MKIIEPILPHYSHKKKIKRKGMCTMNIACCLLNQILLLIFNHWFHVSVSHFFMHPLRPLSCIIKIKLTMERFEGILPSCRAQGKLPERYSTGKGIEKGVGLDMRRWRERYEGYLKRMIGRPCWKIGWVTESELESLEFQAKAVRIFILPRNHYRFYSRGTAWLDLYFRMT